MIRAANIQDLPSILGLWHQMSKLHEDYDTNFTLKKNAIDIFEKYAETVIKSKDKLSTVYCDNRVVGYLFAEIIELPPVYTNEKIGLISEISVDQSFRRMGLGEKLVNHAENWFVEQNIRSIECQVVIRNQLSSNFWSKQGYIEHSLISRKLV